MRTYQYEARRPTGRLERGVTQGADEQAVSRELRAKGYQVIAVRPAGRGAAWLDKAHREALAPVFYPVSAKALSIYFQSIKVMLSAGINIMDLSSTLAKQTNNPMLQRAALEIAEAARDGKPMSSVMRRYPSAFDPAAIAMVETGEQSGMMELVMQRLTEYYDRLFQLQQSYRSQTFYPKILLMAVILIPALGSLVQAFLLGGSGAGVLIGVLRSFAAVLLPLGLIWYGYRAVRQYESFRRAIDRLKLSVPWFGSLARRMMTARWGRALAMMLTAGVPVQRALQAAALAGGNAALEQEMLRAARMTEQGRSMAEAIATVPYIPRMAQDMISTAERAGSVESALDKIADYYESETEVGGKQTVIVVGVLIFAIIAAVAGYIIIKFWGGYFAGIMHMLEQT
jgi:type IV pilus assembly protein PilC